MSIFILLLIVGIFIFSGSFEQIEPRYGALIIIGTLAVIISYKLHLKIKELNKKRKRLNQIDGEFPDALFQLGSRISEGRPLERALEDTAAALKGTAISKTFQEIVIRSKMNRISLTELLSPGNTAGIELTETVSATMKVVVEAVNKNSSEAGEIIIDISNYLRDLKTMDELLKQRMNEVLQTIKQTGMIFAPVIIGLTTAMYFMLNANLSGMEFQGGFGFGGFGSADPIPGEIFVLIFGIYLLLTLCIITYFVTGIESADDSVLFYDRLSKSLVIAVCIFCVSSIMGFHIFT